MKIHSIIATTHIDAHNERFTREALEKAAESVNHGNKPLLMLEHDMTIPPHGKMLFAGIEKRDDGEYQLVSEEEIFEEAEWFLFEDGTRLFREESKNDWTPFVDRYESLISDGYEISLDVVNFDSFAAAKTFIEEVKGLTKTDFTDSGFGRKAAVPDPEIIIKLAETIAAYLIARDVVNKLADRILDEVGNAIADDAAAFYAFAKTIIGRYARYARPRGRPITYVFVVAKQPRIEFIARTNDPDFVLSAIMIEKLKAAISKTEHLGRTLGAAKIQFLLDESGEWTFNYLLTASGGVVGTEQAFSNRARKLELLLQDERS